MEPVHLSIAQAIDLGIYRAMNGDHKSAAEIFSGVLIHQPENVEVMNRLGASLFDLGLLHKALYYFWRTIKADPRHANALQNYGLCLSQLGHWQEGLAFIERAIRHLDKDPHASASAKAMAYNNLGNTYERLNRHLEALIALDQGIRYDPTDAFPHYNRGIALIRLNRHREGIAALEHSLTLQPNDTTTSRLNTADANYNLAMAHFLTGNFEKAIPLYESRLLTSENQQPNFGLAAADKWQPGEDISGKILLVHCEQGIGDSIQFLRFLEPLAADFRPKEIWIIAQEAIRSSLGGLPVKVLQPGEVVLSRSAVWAPMEKEDEEQDDEVEPPRFDRWCALMSLPLYYGITSETELPPPWQPPRDAERFNKWASGFNSEASQLKVGICWAGHFRHKNDKHRSIALQTFASILDAPCTFVSVQQMREGELEVFAELQASHPNLKAAKLDDFRDTAALMKSFDLMISVDTAPAHMAASLGIPTWILLPKYSTDWRWQLERSDSPWYPCVRLYRQDKIGDWKPTLERVRRDLTAMAQRAAA